MTEVLRIGNYNVSDRVLRAVQDASVKTGADFGYMMAKAAQESAFRPEVKAGTSSATGLYQFIDSTWLGVVKEHGAEHGLGQYADQIVRGSRGWTVADPAARREILDLRKNPEAAAMMAAEFALDNKAHLERTVGGEIGPTELYFAHFLGAGGASEFLNAMHANPDRSAASLFPAAAGANRSIFYGEGGARSLRQVYNLFDGIVDRGMALADDVPPGFSAATAGPGGGIDLTVGPRMDGPRMAGPLPSERPDFAGVPGTVFDWLRIQPRVVRFDSGNEMGGDETGGGETVGNGPVQAVRPERSRVEAPAGAATAGLPDAGLFRPASWSRVSPDSLFAVLATSAAMDAAADLAADPRAGGRIG